MKRELLGTIDILSRINDFCSSRVISQVEIKEQKENLEDFDVMLDELLATLETLEDYRSLSVDDIVETLLQLHLKLSDYIWHVDQVHELVKKMAGNYRGSI